MVHRVERDAALQAGRLVAQPRGHPSVRALMHAKRKDENDEFEYRFDEVRLLQKDSPLAGNFRLAWWVAGSLRLGFSRRRF
jgi:hypothetical protein